MYTIVTDMSFENITPQFVRGILLTPWRRVLSEKLTGPQLVKKFPVFYGTQRFITAFTSALHLPLS
jgi:hypothetical protein